MLQVKQELFSIPRVRREIAIKLVWLLRCCLEDFIYKVQCSAERRKMQRVKTLHTFLQFSDPSFMELNDFINTMF